MGRFPEAEFAALEAFERARSLRHPAIQAMTLIWAGEVFAWMENWSKLRKIADELDAIVGANGFAPIAMYRLGCAGKFHMWMADTTRVSPCWKRASTA